MEIPHTCSLGGRLFTVERLGDYPIGIHKFRFEQTTLFVATLDRCWPTARPRRGDVLAHWEADRHVSLEIRMATVSTSVSSLVQENRAGTEFGPGEFAVLMTENLRVSSGGTEGTLTIMTPRVSYVPLNASLA